MQRRTELMRAVLAPTPPATLTMHDLALLTGQSSRRIRNYLLSKHLIEKSDAREHHYVDAATLIDRAPGFWKTIQMRAAKELATARAA